MRASLTCLAFAALVSAAAAQPPKGAIRPVSAADRDQRTTYEREEDAVVRHATAVSKRAVSSICVGCGVGAAEPKRPVSGAAVRPRLAVRDRE